MLFRRVALAAALASALIVGATPAAFGARAVYSSGSGDLKMSWHADFDAGVITTSIGGDLKYNGITSSEHYLEPLGIARIKLIGATRPGYLKCKSAALSGTPIRVQANLIGKWFCYKTQAGRYGRFRLNSYPPHPEPINLNFRTWV